MNTKCVSIIVPVYNGESYLSGCLETIINQTYKNLQIILVNDGSTDNTGSICDEYAKKDNRIEVYHLENHGVSYTRNFALTKIKGEYVQFIDCDDRIKPEMTQVLVSAIEEKKVDMAVCNYIKNFKKFGIPNEILEKQGVYSNYEYLKNTLKDAGHHYYGVVWNKLYRRSIIQDNSIIFEETVNLGEDFIFNLSYLLKCRNVNVCKKYLYYYNKSRESTLSSKMHKTIQDCKWELGNRKKYSSIIRGLLKKRVYMSNLRKRYIFIGLCFM